MDTQSYKRTIKGSVGAGVSALVNGGGRTYYILEHKSNSQYHKAGDTQKIIVDQIELGRASSCQVRFDESFETVSRRHAAIVREGENWKLVHLSQSNPTLVNGHPISGNYYLQTGDEIQLSVNGPRLGFIVPQGKQALTSSIGMTERMNLFRQQALRPYKKALIAISVLFVLCVAGLTAGMIHQEKTFTAEINKTKNEVETLRNNKDDLIAKNQILKKEIESGKDQNKDLLEKYNNNIQRINSLSAQINNKNQELREFIAKQNEINAKAETARTETDNLYEAETEDNESSVVTGDVNRNIQYSDISTTSSTEESPNASSDLKDYYDYIYTIKIDRIEVEMNGLSIDPGIQVSDIICGTGFMLEDGTFVTDRQNIEPWVYSENARWKENWRYSMAKYVACGGKVIIHYRAYSTLGTGKPLYFVNNEFSIDRSGDTDLEIEIDKQFRKEWKDLFGVPIMEKYWVRKSYAKIGVVSDQSKSYAYIRNKGQFGEGIPVNKEIASTLPGGTDIHMVGYAGSTNPHNPRPAHFNDKINVDDTLNGTIKLQGQVFESGYYGSPAFYKGEDATYKVIGVMVGSVGGRDRLVPINNILNH